MPVTGKDIRAAADTVLAGKPVPGDQKGRVGCNRPPPLKPRRVHHSLGDGGKVSHLLSFRYCPSRTDHGHNPSL
jgi:hypothetical protein